MSSGHASKRAEARRRSRIAAREQADTGEASPEALQVAAPPTQQTGTAAVSPTRIGFSAAFRGSFGKVSFKDDLRTLPHIVRTRAFFVPLAATAATVVVGIQPGILSTSLGQLAVQTILLPPAFVVAFIAGMLTRRGSWMLGGIFGIITYAGSLVVGSVVDLSALDAANPVGSFLQRNVANLNDLGALAGDLYGVMIAGIFAGAFAGWYGRFLRAMSPQPSTREGRRDGAAQRKGGGRR